MKITLDPEVLEFVKAATEAVKMLVPRIGADPTKPPWWHELGFQTASEHLAKQTASNQTAFNVRWLDQCCTIDAERVRAGGYTWREMLGGSRAGFRRGTLSWALRRTDLHDAVTRYRCAMLLVEGYGEMPFNVASTEPPISHPRRKSRS
jgi:hypothetical protein